MGAPGFPCVCGGLRTAPGEASLPLSLMELFRTWVLGPAGVFPTAVGMIPMAQERFISRDGVGASSVVTPLVTSSVHRCHCEAEFGDSDLGIWVFEGLPRKVVACLSGMFFQRLCPPSGGWRRFLPASWRPC